MSKFTPSCRMFLLNDLRIGFNWLRLARSCSVWAQNCQLLPGADHLSALAKDLLDDAGIGGPDGQLGFHGIQNNQLLSYFDVLSRLDGNLKDACCHGRTHGLATFR